MSRKEFFDDLTAFSSPRKPNHAFTNFHEFQQLRICRAGENFITYRVDLIDRRVEHLRSVGEMARQRNDIDFQHEIGTQLHAAVVRLLLSMKYNFITDLYDSNISLYYSCVARELAAPELSVTLVHHHARAHVAIRGLVSHATVMRDVVEKLVKKTSEEIEDYPTMKVPE